MPAQQRLDALVASLPSAGPGAAPRAASAAPSPDDIVIVAGARTPIGKAPRGILKDTPPVDMLAVAVREAVKRAGIDAKLVEDIVVGNVLQEGAGGLTARMGTLLAGVPYTHSVMAVNRQCSSGLQAIANVAASIRSGSVSVGVAAGVDSMSGCASAKTPFPNNVEGTSHTLTKEALDTAMKGGHPNQDDHMADALVPMGITSENVATQFGVTRQEQDEFAAKSWANAVKAVKAGCFKEEIVPISTKVQRKGKDGKVGPWENVTVTEDEGPRPTPLERLQGLKPVFSKTGSTTAANCSQMSDGAAAVVLMTRAKAQELGCKVLGVWRSFAVAGVPPKIMGIGPVYAIPKALKIAGLGINDVDVWELNEAFASQAVHCAKELRIPADRVNPLGGAIALGHPLGATGCRQVVTLLHHLHRTKQQTGAVSMCVGTGMGAAAVLSRE